MANNSCGARSVLYGKTIDHVLEQEVVLSDGSVVTFGPLDAAGLEAASAGESLAAQCYRAVRGVAAERAPDIERRFPKVLRRVGGYNLDEFIHPEQPFNLAKLMVGSEGTLGVVLSAKVNLVPLPKAKAVMAIQFSELLDRVRIRELDRHLAQRRLRLTDIADMLGYSSLSAFSTWYRARFNEAPSEARRRLRQRA